MAETTHESDTVPTRDASRESAPRESAPRENAPRENVSRETTSRESAAREPANRESAPRESSPRESAPREPVTREVPPREVRDSRSTARTSSSSSSRESTIRDPDAVRQALAGKHVCPFCGATAVTAGEPCPRCTMEDSPATRQATKVRIGPWYVLQTRNPAAPGMKFSTLVALVHKGQVSPRSIVRGPTTHQLWRFAAHVRGLSREFGLCYSCGDPLEKTSAYCPHCERPQEPPADPDVLLEQLNGSTQRPLPRQSDGREFDPRQTDLHQSQSRQSDTRQSDTRYAQSRTPAMTQTGTPQSDGPHAPAPHPATYAGAAPQSMSPSSAAVSNVPAEARDFGDRLRSPAAGIPVMIGPGGKPSPVPPRRTSRGTLSAMELAAAMQGEQNAVRPRRSWVLRGIFFFIALGLLSLGVLESVDDSYRKNAVAWTQSRWQSLMAQMEAARVKSNNTKYVPPGERPADRVEKPDRAPTPQRDPVVAQDPPRPQPTPVVKTPPKPSPQPLTPPSVPQGTSEIKVSSANSDTRPKPAPVTPAPITPASVTPQPSPSKIEVGNMTPAALEKLARDLYYQGLDAEGQGDWSKALDSYNSIASLPTDYHYRDLKIRIARAKQQLAR